MSKAIENLQAAQKRAMENRPKIGGFPYLAEVLKQAGVKKNIWYLPSLQSVYLTDFGPVVNTGVPLVNGMTDIAPFDKERVIKALRKDQAGESTFAEFLMAIWKAGVVHYEVDFLARRVIYVGCNNETYIEEYPEVKLSQANFPG